MAKPKWPLTEAEQREIAKRRGFEAIGRNARRKGWPLKAVLTKNPELDRYITEGYNTMPVAKPFTTDLFGNKLARK